MIAEKLLTHNHSPTLLSKTCIFNLIKRSLFGVRVGVFLVFKQIFFHHDYNFKRLTISIVPSCVTTASASRLTFTRLWTTVSYPTGESGPKRFTRFVMPNPGMFFALYIPFFFLISIISCETQLQLWTCIFVQRMCTNERAFLIYDVALRLWSYTRYISYAFQ